MAVDGFEKLSLAELLAAYLSSEDEGEAEAALTHLLEKHASKQITTYFERRVSTRDDQSNFRFTRADGEDLAGKATVDLISALKQRREFSLSDGIGNPGGFITSICYAAFADFWRRRFAEYNKLKNRIRYLMLRRRSTFSTRRDERNRIICSLADSPSHRSIFSREEIIDRVKDAVTDYPINEETGLVNEALAQARGWLYLGEVVEILAELRGIKDIPPSEMTEPDDYLAGFASDVDEDHKRRNLFDLGFLWAEIGGLPRFQRLALLYNLRDEEGKELNSVWFESEIATLAELAMLFEVDESAMAQLLVQLPYSDRQIAKEMEIEDAVKVANLRKVAREYLDRRIRGKPKRRR